MVYLSDVIEEFARLDKLLGIDTSFVKISISRKMTKLWGNITYDRINANGQISYKPTKFTIAAHLVEFDDLFWLTAKRQYARIATVLFNPCSIHQDERWREICYEIGCNPDEALLSSDEHKNVKQSQARYRRFCPDCNTYRFHYGTPRILKNMRNGYICSCGNCKSENIRFEKRDKYGNWIMVAENQH